MINRNRSDFQIETQKPNAATELDVIRAAIYEKNLIVAYGAGPADAGDAGKCPSHIMSILLIPTEAEG